MKEFFKRYSYDSVKMLLDQIAISIFGFSLALTAGRIESESLQSTILWVSSLGAILFYLFLLYGVAWNMGYRRFNIVQRGDEKPQWLNGLWVSLLANSLNLILAVAVACNVIFSEEHVVGTPGGIAVLVQGMYLGLMKTWNLNAYWWPYFLIVLPAVLVCTFGYIFGVKGWHLTNMMMPQTPLSDRPTKQELRERKKEAQKKADTSNENPS